MTVKTRAELKAENSTDFPDNASRLISPAALRGQMNDIVDSALFPEDDIEGGGGLPGPPGSDGASIDGMAALRGTAPVNGFTVRLNYHTTPGDYGAGLFYGKTTGGPWTDNDGTIIVPDGGDGSAAWLRVWDRVKAHVGWFGAKCQPETAGGADDYIPAKKCFDLFTNGRSAGGGPGGGTILTGIVDVGPGFNFSQPLLYGGANGGGFKLVGSHSLSSAGQEKSLLRYTGPKTDGAIILYGAGGWWIEDINVVPELALNGVMVISDNSYNNSGVHTTTHAITAGSNVVVTPSGADAAAKIVYLQAGCYLGVDYGTNHNGLGGGDNFELVYITAVDTVAGTFTADFRKNHASGVLLGGGLPSSGGRVNRCSFVSPASPIYTTLAADALGGGAKTYVVADITGIEVGRPVRIGHGLAQEIVYPDSVNVGANSFHAPASNFSHITGERVMYPTAGIYIGNMLLGTVQVSEISFYDTYLVGGGYFVVDGVNQSKSYAGVRQVWGGNVKNLTFHAMYTSHLRVPFAFEQPSGQYIISGGVSAGISDTLFLCPGGTLIVEGWEDESLCIWTVAYNTNSQATFIGCTMQGAVPTAYFGPVTDEIFYYGGQLTLIGCQLYNGRIAGTTLPIIVCTSIDSDLAQFAGSVTIISCSIVGVTLANMNFVRRGSGDTTDVIKAGNARFTMLNCNGGYAASRVHLPNIVPPQKMWEGSATAVDPPSLAASAVGTIGTISVPGAALGDLTEASFSLDLNGAALRAWVSAADTVKYQFANPTAAPIDLASGTVKVRVKK